MGCDGIVASFSTDRLPLCEKKTLLTYRQRTNPRDMERVSQRFVAQSWNLITSQLCILNALPNHQIPSRIRWLIGCCGGGWVTDRLLKATLVVVYALENLKQEWTEQNFRRYVLAATAKLFAVLPRIQCRYNADTMQPSRIIRAEWTHVHNRDEREFLAKFVSWWFSTTCASYEDRKALKATSKKTSDAVGLVVVGGVSLIGLFGKHNLWCRAAASLAKRPLCTRVQLLPTEPRQLVLAFATPPDLDCRSTQNPEILQR
jgi:hypothetical protein